MNIAAHTGSNTAYGA